MAAKLFLDKIEDVECKEENGVVTELTRVAKIINLDNVFDYTVLDLMLKVSGLPAPYDPPGDSTGRFDNLVCVSRVPKTDADTNTGTVTLVYKHKVGEYQNLDIGRNTAMAYGEMRGSTQQKSINSSAYTPPVTMDNSPTFGAPGSGVANANSPLATIKFPQLTFASPAATYPPEGGEVSSYESRETLSVKGIQTIADPEFFLDGLLNTINRLTWRNANPYTWWCSDIKMKICDTKSKTAANGVTGLRWFMEYEFQYTLDTWNPQVIYIDPVTGNPPPYTLSASDTGTNGILNCYTLAPADFPGQMGFFVYPGPITDHLAELKELEKPAAERKKIFIKTQEEMKQYLKEYHDQENKFFQEIARKNKERMAEVQKELSQKAKKRRNRG